ncbi:MAG: macro domain-containing protein [Bacteroidota bacterium]
MHIQCYLVDLNSSITDAWNQVFAEIESVSIHNDSIFNHPCDAIVSPANSFGYMNGGIDFVISKNLGWHIEKRLQQKIRDKHYGELLIGQAEIVETDHVDFPYLISAPTMRTPMTISRTPNVYLAMKAILILLKDGRLDDGSPVKDKVKRVAMSGLGTGVGQVPPLICARQMRIAWEDVMHEKYTSKEGWKELRSNYAYFFTHNKSDLTYDIP